MNSIKTVFVLKKDLYDSESAGLTKDIKNFLKINIKSAKVINKYIIKNVDNSTFEKSLTSVFSEPMVDDYYIDEIPNLKKYHSFAVEYLPGQFDARAEAAKQCLLLINNKLNPEVKSAKIYLIKGNVSSNDINRIKSFLINPTDSCEVDVYSATFPSYSNNDKKIQIISDFTLMNKVALTELHLSLGLAMSIEDLMMIQDYFKKCRRNPTLTEIKVIDTYWSDHCRHTTFETKINKINFEQSEYDQLFKSTYKAYLDARKRVYGAKAKTRKICLMDLATIAVKDLKNLVNLKI